MYRLVEIIRDDCVEPDYIFDRFLWNGCRADWVEIDCSFGIIELSQYFKLKLLSDNGDEVIVYPYELLTEIGIDNIYMCIRHNNTVIIFILLEIHKFMFDNMKFIEFRHELCDGFNIVGKESMQSFGYYSESSFSSGYAMISDYMDAIAGGAGVYIGYLGSIFDIVCKKLIDDPDEDFVDLYLNTESREFIIDILSDSCYAVYSVTEEFIVWLSKVILFGGI